MDLQSIENELDNLTSRIAAANNKHNADLIEKNNALNEIEIAKAVLQNLQASVTQINSRLASLTLELHDLDVRKHVLEINRNEHLLKLERERMEKLERERIEQEKIRLERLERERVEREKMEKLKLEQLEREREKRERDRLAVERQSKVTTYKTGTFGRLSDAIKSLNIPESIKQQHLRWIDGTDDNDNGKREYVHEDKRYILHNSRVFALFEHKCSVNVTIIG